MSPPSKRIILAGGTGFLGDTLNAFLGEREYRVTVLSRSDPMKSARRVVHWDGRTLDTWASEIEGAFAVINLSGRSVDCRYTPRHRQEILDSRVDSTRILGEAMQGCRQPPEIWLNAGTATLYRHSFDKPMDESSQDFSPTPGVNDAFSVQVAQAWEQAMSSWKLPATRRVILRLGMVLSTRAGSVYAVLRRLASAGLGGSMGDGRQFVSWIHVRDFCRAVEWLLHRPALDGPVNVVAPEPIPNAQMMSVFRRACHRSFGLPASRPMLELGALLLRTETELILKSRRVVPRRLLESGFSFDFPTFEAAIDDLEKSRASHR